MEIFDVSVEKKIDFSSFSMSFICFLLFFSVTPFVSREMKLQKESEMNALDYGHMSRVWVDEGNVFYLFNFSFSALAHLHSFLTALFHASTRFYGAH